MRAESRASACPSTRRAGDARKTVDGSTGRCPARTGDPGRAGEAGATYLVYCYVLLAVPTDQTLARSYRPLAAVRPNAAHRGLITRIDHAERTLITARRCPSCLNHQWPRA